MIVHLLPGDFTHLTIPLIDSIINNSKKDHFFLIPVFQKEKREKYIQLFEKHPSSKFLIFDSSSNTKLSRLLMYLLGNRGTHMLEEAAIAAVIFKFRKNAIISHFYYKSYALLPIFKSYTWVCWGNIPKLVPDCSKIEMLKFNYYTKRILRKCKNIVTLMNPDKEELVNTYKCKESRISVIPYIFSKNKDITGCNDRKNPIGKQKILLGNNTFLINSYANALPFLKRYSDHCLLYAMMSYGNASDLEKEDFISKAKEIFKDNFTPVLEFIPLESYNAWLNQFDIYISGAQTQSGLGAIYSMLDLGKKVFLAGYNYEWCIKNRLIVFHINEIFNGELSNLSPLSKEQCENNKRILNKMLDADTLNQKWDDFYTNLHT